MRLLKESLLPACLSLTAACAVSAADAAPASASGPMKDSKPPAAVGPELLRLLNTKINLAVKDMAPSLALAWQLRLAEIPLAIEASDSVEAQRVSFELQDVTLAEALRKIANATGAQYRIEAKTIRLALADEWKAIDAGTKRFEQLRSKK